MNKMQKYYFDRMNPLAKDLYLLSFKHSLRGKRALRDEISCYTQINALRSDARHYRDELKQKLINFGNKGEWSKHYMRKLENTWKEAKLPINMQKHISVEIECIFPDEECLITFKKLVASAGVRKNVCIKSDGSITPDTESECQNCGGADDNCCDEPYFPNSHEMGKEIVVTFEHSKPEVLKYVCKALNTVRAYVNKSCGLHVHFDMRQVRRVDVTSYAKRLSAVVPLLRKMLPKSRRDNYYCRSDISKRGDRYAFVNTTAYSKHKTLEIRGHSGTVSYEKILNWMRLMEHIMNTKRIDIGMSDVGEISSVTFAEMLYMISVPNDLYEYCMNRVRKFSPEMLPTSLNTKQSMDVIAEQSEVA